MLQKIIKRLSDKNSYTIDIASSTNHPHIILNNLVGQWNNDDSNFFASSRFISVSACIPLYARSP